MPRFTFVGDAFRELGRKRGRSRLRAEVKRQERERQRVLTSLGALAWQLQVPLSPAERQNLTVLERHANSLAVAQFGLQAEVTRLEGLRADEMTRSGQAQQAVKAAKQPIDTALVAAQARNAPPPELAWLTQESARHGNELARIIAAHRAALAELDRSLYNVRSELATNSAATTTAARQRDEFYSQLGGTLYATGRRDPQLAQMIDRVAALDQARGMITATLQASVAESAAAPHGAMLKLAGLLMLVSIVLAVVIGIAMTRDGKPKPRGGAIAFQPFSADAVVIDPTQPKRTVKLYVTERAMRSEGVENGNSFVLILRRDKSLMWSLSPDTKLYSEQKFGDAPTSVELSATTDPHCKVEKQEEMSGYQCEKQVCSTSLGTGHQRLIETRWAAVELGGYVIKSTDGYETIELTNIDVGPQDSSLFELPGDYHPKGD